jgi:hypothetical protein
LLAHSTHSFDSLQRIAAANERLVKQLWSERSREDHSRALRSDALAEERLAQTLDEKDEEK